MSFVQQLFSPFVRKESPTEDFEPALYQPLLDLLKNRQLLKVALDGHSGSLQSMIVDIDFENKRLVLDGFSPRLQDRTSVIGLKLTISHQSNQQQLSFSGVIKTWDPATDSYMIDLPKPPSYKPRRQEERLLLAGQRPLYSKVKPIFGAPWQATIKNISAGGMRVSVVGDVREPLTSSSSVQCELMVSTHFSIKLSGVVRGYRFVGRPYRNTEISIEFTNLNNKLLNQIEQLLNTLSNKAA